MTVHEQPGPAPSAVGRARRLRPLAVLAAVAVASVAAGGPAVAAAPEETSMRTICLLFSRDLPPYREAVEGLKDRLCPPSDAPDRPNAYTFAERIVTEIEIDALLEWLHAQRPDLVVTLGTEASKVAAVHAGNTPVLFAMVANPIDNGILPRRSHPGQLVCGVTTDVDPAEQFKVLKQALPEAERVGVIYCPQYTEATVAAGARAAADAGLDLARLPVEPYRVAPAIQRLHEKDVDALWTVTDPGVMVPASALKILTSALKARLPVLGFSPAMVRAGAVVGFGIDPRAIGRQAGDIAHALLREGKTPKDFHLVYPGQAAVHVNLQVAERVGVRLPTSLLADAERIKGQ
ncbi:MAG: ABC transporter substrate binding protein [Phycisphaerae bacterium]